MAKSRITARKYGGDDTYCWAVFIDNQPMVTGLSRREVPYYKAQAEEILAERTRGSLSAPATDTTTPH